MEKPPAKALSLSPLMKFYLGLSSQNTTNDAVYFDTLFKFEDTTYILNMDCREGCQSAGYCNVIVQTKGESVRRINYIKGYIDSVVSYGNSVYLFAKVVDGYYKTAYRFVLRDKFVFDSLIEQRIVSNNIQVQVQTLGIDTAGVNRDIGWE